MTAHPAARVNAMISAAYPWSIWAWHNLTSSDTFVFETEVSGIGRCSFELTSSQVSLVGTNPTLLVKLITDKLIAVGLLHSDGSRHRAGDDHEDHAKPLRDAENELPRLGMRDAEDELPEVNVPGSDYTWESLGALVDLLLDPSRFVRTRVSTIRELIEHRVAPEQKARQELAYQLEKARETASYLAGMAWDAIPTDITDPPQPLPPRTPGSQRLDEERSREESIELVTAMVAGAGFELIRDIPGETAMWSQHLADLRPAVQVFLQVTHRQLVDLSPAELYTFIRNQVGAS